ncbi:MAG: hypothetical protein R3F11_27360 [Verrucomicrobiales bacterium]
MDRSQPTRRSGRSSFQKRTSPWSSGRLRRAVPAPTKLTDLPEPVHGTFHVECAQ